MDCSCGQFYGIENRRPGIGSDHIDDVDDDCSLVSQCYSTTTARAATTQPLDVSFVHLPTPSLLNYHHFASSAGGGATITSQIENNNQKKQYSYHQTLEYYQHLELLEQVVMANSSTDSSELSSLSLCIHCAERVLQAMETDTERLEQECQLYRQTIQDEDIRIRNLQRAIRNNANTFTSSSSSSSSSSSPEEESSSASFDNKEDYNDNQKEDDDDEEEDDKNIYSLAETYFKNQLEALKENCRLQQVELTHVVHLLQEQTVMAQELDVLEWTCQEEYNSLELEAQAFDNEQEQLHGKVIDTLVEVDQLSSSAVRFPSILYDLRIYDNKQQSSSSSLLSYPTINELRLAYRPIPIHKNVGDNNNNDNMIQWTEIQAAWSLAAQLLLAIGSLLEFTSQHWKIVPLSHCAKIIYYPPPSNTSATASSSQKQQQQPASAAATTGIVHNLGHPKSNCAQALVTWNGLLHSMVEHAMTKIAKARERSLFLNSSSATKGNIATATTSSSAITAAAAGGTSSSSSSTEAELFPKLPFAMSVNSIGPHRTWPGVNDDAGWARVIHCMSCNLQWLSNVASTLTLQEVLLATCTVPHYSSSQY